MANLTQGVRDELLSLNERYGKYGLLATLLNTVLLILVLLFK